MKKNIGILFGGKSPEYGVSLESAHAVITNIDYEKYNPILIGISKKGEWFYFKGDVNCLEDDSWCENANCLPAMISANLIDQALLVIENNQIVKIKLDAIFPIMHGKYGEDGCMQGLVSLSGIPLIGCGVLSSSLCMDKYRAHKLVSEQGVNVAKSFLVNQSQDIKVIQKKAQSIGYPLYVKPLRAGSSFGITKVVEENKLFDAIRIAFEYDDEILIEENIQGFEVGCSIIGKKKLIIGEVDEIEVSEDFFTFDEKYNLGSTTIHVPARITKEKTREIKVIAEKIYRILNCEVFARIDFFLTPKGDVVFNEVNTIPGLTSHSRFPTMMEAKGYSLKSLITTIIEMVVQDEKNTD